MKKMTFSLRKSSKYLYFSLLLFVIGISFFIIVRSLYQNKKETPSFSQLSAKDKIEKFCTLHNGSFIYEFNEKNKYIECEGIDKKTCEENGGIYTSCASPCRHMDTKTYCAQICIAVCSW